MDIIHIQEYFELAHFKLQHLFCFRQRLFDCNKGNTLAYKPHGCCHLAFDISYLGPPPSQDTVIFEHKHIVCAKRAYASSSRQEATTLPEMITNLQANRLAKALTDEMEVTRVNTRHTTVHHNTEGNVIFEASISSRFRDLVTFHFGIVDAPERYLNPNVTINEVWASLKRTKNRFITKFLKQYEQGHPGQHI